MINKNLVYKVPGLSFNVERLTKTYKEILRNKKFDQGDGSVSHIDSISLNKIPDVFDVKIEVSDLTSSTRFIRSRFAAAFSIMASHIQS